MPKCDLTTVIRDFSYISNIYRYIESYNLKGHQIGRKVGDMLELITLSKVYNVPELRQRLKIEPKLEGFTKAGHKVEFAFFNKPETNPPSDLIGFIECKKVGVEVTASKTLLVKGEKETVALSCKPDWLTKLRGAGEFKFYISMDAVGANEARVSCQVTGSDDRTKMNVPIGGKIKLGLVETGDAFMLNPDEHLIKIKPLIRDCLVLELDSIKDAKCKWRVYDCLTGPQTIEKAKQASLVAMDLRKKVSGKWGKEELKPEEAGFVSMLVIGEVSHWEPKSRHVVRCCIDHSLVVPDEVVIAAFERFQKEFGAGFLDKISKDEYLKTSAVRKAIDAVVDDYEGEVLYDLDLGTYVDFAYADGKLKVVPHEATTFAVLAK